MKTLLLTKSTAWCRLAQAYARQVISDLTICEGQSGDPLPETVQNWTGGRLLSFVCPWYIPETVLAQVPLALNWHPGPPEHPGFAPYSWALYLGDKQYGITVHEMTARIDAGRILEVERFPIYLVIDDVYHLQSRTMDYLLASFRRALYRDFRYFDPGPWVWTRRARTRQDFETLRHLSPSMPPEEIAARERACRYPGHAGAEFEVLS